MFRTLPLMIRKSLILTFPISLINFQKYMAVTPTVYKCETSVKNSVKMYHYQF